LTDYGDKTLVEVARFIGKHGHLTAELKLRISWKQGIWILDPEVIRQRVLKCDKRVSFCLEKRTIA